MNEKQPFEEEPIEMIDLPATKRPARAIQWLADFLQKHLLHPPLTRQQRWRRSLITVTGVVIALVLLLGSTLIYRAPTTSTPPRPTPAPVAGPGLFYFQVLPGWGQLLIDQKAVAKAPVWGDGPPLQLGRGKHVLEWKATPFQSIKCNLNVGQYSSKPLADPKACPLRATEPTSYAKEASLVLLPISLKTLSDENRASLVEAAQMLLDTKQLVGQLHPGDRFAFPQDPSQFYVAKEELTATQRLVLDSDTQSPASCTGLSLGESCTIEEQDCRLFCMLNQWPDRDPLLPQWHVAAIFHVETTLRTQSGQPLSTPSHLRPNYQFVTLQVIWAQDHWQVNFHQNESTFDDPLCISTASTIFSNRAYSHLPATAESIGWTFHSDLRNGGACLASAQIETPRGQSQLLLLSRFGVLLTANAAAKDLWPSLPSATSEERDLALSLYYQATY